MIDLATLANVAEVVGGAALVGGIAFAIVQMRQIQRQRMDAAAIELGRSTFLSEEFLAAQHIVWDLPDGLTGPEVEALGKEVSAAARRVGGTFETLGLFVHRRVVPFELVADLIGGSLTVTWRKLGPWASWTREEMGFDDAYEWYQWLAERVAQHAPHKAMEGAHVRERDWRP